MAFPSWLRHCAAMVLVAGLLGLAFGCKKGSNSSFYNVNGSVTYTRPALAYSDGSPNGIGTTGAGSGLAARGVTVRAFQLYYDVGYSGTTTPAWRLVGTAVTDDNGAYTIGGVVAAGYPTFVEVDSIFQQSGGHASQVRLVADRITSQLSEPNRPIYALRQDVAGTSFTDPTPTATSVAVAWGSATVNFAVGNGTGAGDTWAVTDPNWYMPAATMAPAATQAIGSRVLAILDSAYYFSYFYGDPTPSASKGGFLDLHYYPGVTAAASPQRSYVVYDPTTTPLAVDGSGQYHYFGTLSGSSAQDDAFDQGVIFPILARNNLYGQRKTSLFPTGLSSLASLAPDLAVVDGLADAMAATLLKTPYLTDLSASTALVPRDIRVVPANPGLTSPATLASLAWDFILQAQGLSDNAAQWATLDPDAMVRFFTLVYPTITTGTTSSGTVSYQNDISSGWAQLGRLQEPKSGADTVDLRLIFNDGVIYAAGTYYGFTWDTSMSLATYAASDIYSSDWGTNPVSLTGKPALSLSMAQATLVPQQTFGATPAVASVYPNCSAGEVAYAKLALTLDRNYALSFTPAPPAGSTLEVVVDGNTSGALSFSSTDSQNLTLLGNTWDSTNPVWHFLRFRLLSPTVKQADYTVTVNLNRID